MDSKIKSVNSNNKYLVLIASVFCILLAIVAYLFYKNEETRIRNEKQANLEAIANLKINELVRWKEERLSEARFFPGEALFRINTAKLLSQNKDLNAKEYFVKSLSHIRKSHSYNNLFIVSPENKIVFSLDENYKKLESELFQDIQKSIKTKDIVIKDFYKCELHKSIHFDIISPIENGNNRIIALLILRINPEDYLYPLIQTWPLPSISSETLIFRNDGDKVLFLNELRHRKNSALNLSIPLWRKDVASVQGALGFSGITESIDYRNVKVLAFVHRIPGTPWLMVAKTDQDEVYAEARYTARLVIVITIVIILFLIAFLIGLFKQRQNKLLKEIILKDANISEVKEEFRTALYSIGDAVITTDVNGRIKQMNFVAENLTGWKEEEAAGKQISEAFNIVNEDTREAVVNPVQRVLLEGIIVGLANHTILISKTGNEIPISDSGSPIKNKFGEIVGVVLVFRDQTEEREAEKKLKESEEKYRALVETSNDAIFINKNNKIVYLNSTAVKLFGAVNPEQLIGKSPLELFHIDYHNVVKSRMDKLLDSWKPIEFIEDKMILANGKIFYAEITAIPFYIGGDKAIQVVLRDINKRKKAEEAARSKDELLHMTGRMAKVGGWEFDTETLKGTWTDEVARIHDLDPGDETNVEIGLSFYSGEDRQKIEASLKDAVENAMPYDLELELITHKNNHKLIRTMGLPIIEDGKVVKVRGIFQDITERKQAEEKLKESEERYRSIFQNTHSIMFIINPDTSEIIDTNPAACRFYGYSYEEFLSKKISDINLFTEEQVIEEMQAAKRESRNQFFFRHKLANGVVKDVEVYSGPIMLNGRKVLYSIVHDITARKLAEKALKASEDKFSTAFKTSPDSININRLSDGLYYEVNEGFCSVTGYSPEEVIGKTSRDINIWANPADRLQLTNGLHENGKVNNLEVQVRLKNGKIITALMSAQIIIINGDECILNITRDITERKKAEEALRESEQRLRLFVEHTPAAIAMLDNEMRYISVSRRWFSDYNLDIKTNIIGLCHYDVFPEIPARWKEIHRRCLAGSVEKCEEDPFLRSDGTLDWIRWEIHPWKSHEGEIGGIIIFSEVVTERKKAEEAFKEKARLEEQISKIAVTAPGGLFSFRMSAEGSFNFLYVSPIWEDLYSLTQEDVFKDVTIIGQRFHPDDIEKIDKSIAKSAKEMTTWHTEFRIVNPQKGIIWVEGHATPSRQKDNSIVWHGFITNITERKLAEENIRKLSRGIEQSPAIIMITDIKGNIEYTNKKFTEITGYTFAEIKGRSTHFLSAESINKDDSVNLWTTILNKKDWHGEFLNRKKSGEFYWESATISSILNDNGEITNFIAVKEDITERKRMTDELIEAKEKAEEMNRVKSYFFANMSHELRTPFVGIIGFSEILTDILQNPEERGMAETILQSSRRLTDTLNKILNITKLEFDKIDIRITDTDISMLIKNLYVLYSKTAKERKTLLEIKADQETIVWRTDEKLLHEILSNLINNALKFTSKGSIKVSADKISRDNTNYLVIKVSDTGIGIPLNKQRLIWQEFRQAHEGYNRPFEGTGLGLSITKKYVERLGGNIFLESEEGAGSVFTVELPDSFQFIPEANKEIPANNIQIKNKETAVIPHNKILYVEDDTVSLEFVKIVLNKNFNVDFAENAESALELIKNNFYAMLLIDINLGYGMNGIELLRTAREITIYKDIPAIAVTAYASNSDKEEFLSKGFTDYISKPFSSKDLISLIEKTIRS